MTKDPRRVWRLRRFLQSPPDSYGREPPEIHYAGVGHGLDITICGALDGDIRQPLPMSDRRPVECEACAHIVADILGWPYRAKARPLTGGGA